MTFREKYVSEMDTVAFSDSFEIRTVNLMMQEAERKDEKALPKRKPLKILTVAIAIITLLSLTVFAISSLLSAKEVADYLGEKEIAEMFEGNDFEAKSATDGTFTVTLLGITTGTRLNATEGFECDETKSYAVVAISRNDGTPLYGTDGMPIMLTPVVEGYRPDTVFSLGSGANGYTHEGVLYYLFEYENLEIFSFRKVSIAAFEGFFPTADILTTDENGKIVYAEGYNGFKGIFDLPMDKSKADKEAADTLLSNF